MMSIDVILVKLLTDEFMIVKSQIIADIFIGGQRSYRLFIQFKIYELVKI